MTENIKLSAEKIVEDAIHNMKIDGIRPTEKWEIESAFIKGDGSIIVLLTHNPTTFRLGAKMYHVNDTISGSYWAAMPVASRYIDGTWYSYEGDDIVIDESLPKVSAWGNEDMDELDWLIFNNMN